MNGAPALFFTSKMSFPPYSILEIYQNPFKPGISASFLSESDAKQIQASWYMLSEKLRRDVKQKEIEFNTARLALEDKDESAESTFRVKDLSLKMAKERSKWVDVEVAVCDAFLAFLGRQKDTALRVAAIQAFPDLPGYTRLYSEKQQEARVEYWNAL